MSQIVIGVVCSCQGLGGTFTQLDWVRRQSCEKLGFHPYPDTLNLHIHNSIALAVGRMGQGVRIEPWAEGYCAAQCFRVRIRNTIRAAWILPEMPGYPNDLMEIMAPVSLRKTLRVEDGDLVEIEILGEHE